MDTFGVQAADPSGGCRVFPGGGRITRKKPRKSSCTMDTDSDDASLDKENQVVDARSNIGVRHETPVKMALAESKSPTPRAHRTRAHERYMLGDEERRRVLEQTIFENLLEKQKHCRIAYNPDGKYLRYRSIIIDWMAEVCDEYTLPAVICHLSVRYLDEILGREDVAKSKLQLVALCCILVAAKYREPEDNIPPVDELNECSDKAYNAHLITKMELLVLKALKWRMGLPTAQDFIMFFVGRGVVFPSDRMRSTGKSATGKERSLMLKYVKFFSELSLSEYALQQFLPSLLAAGIIACSRIATCFASEWPRELEQLTRLKKSEVGVCKTHLYRIFLKRYPAEAEAIDTLGSPKSVASFSITS